MKNKYKLQYVTTPFCGVCQTARPLIDMLAQVLNVLVVDIDANKNKALLEDLKITRVPALIVVESLTEEIVYATDEISDLTTMYETISPYIE